jgi:hypothetical protein
MAKSKFFRVAVEGPTVDGRVIERQMLVEAADSYEPDTYTARINCEHIAGYSPDRPFNCYGTVRSLRTEEIELTVNGAKKKLLSLVAEIEANDQLVELNKAGQKLFTSCELHPDFAGGGRPTSWGWRSPTRLPRWAPSRSSSRSDRGEPVLVGLRDRAGPRRCARWPGAGRGHEVGLSGRLHRAVQGRQGQG